MNKPLVIDHNAGHSMAVPVPSSEASAIVSIIERAARDPSVDIDKMERLMAMHERVVARGAQAAFDAALAEMQPELPVICRRGLIEVKEKDREGKRTGPVQQSTPYALWEDINDGIKPILHKHGFALSFRNGMAADGRVTVTGILSHRDGHREETTVTLQHDSSGSKNAVQATGSSYSYGKRYTATALLNITSRGEDDDGVAAGAPGGLTDDQLAEVRRLIVAVDADIPKFCTYMKVSQIEDIPAAQYDKAVRALNMKAGK